jgi:hypothetical protein
MMNLIVMKDVWYDKEVNNQSLHVHYDWIPSCRLWVIW